MGVVTLYWWWWQVLWIHYHQDDNIAASYVPIDEQLSLETNMAEHLQDSYDDNPPIQDDNDEDLEEPDEEEMEDDVVNAGR